MIKLRKILWISICMIVLLWWVNSFYFSPHLISLYKQETQNVLLVWMTILTFPSGFIWLFLFSAIIYIFGLLGISTPIFIEVFLLWLGFILIGYFQWFKFIPFIKIKYFEKS
ncbi:MAG: hypothetical protein ACC657_08970 [Thiohalomonadales bacterium]